MKKSNNPTDTGRGSVLRLGLLILFCGCSIGMNAASYDFVHYDACDGMNGNQVTDILQLPDGRMAIKTIGGLNIFDGASFRYVHHSGNHKPFHLLKGFGRWRLSYGEGDILWLQQWQELECFDLRSFRYVENVDSLLLSMGCRGDVLDFWVDGEGKAWALQGDSVRRLTNTVQSIAIEKAHGLLREIDVRGGVAYLFYDDGTLFAYDVRTGRPLYHNRGYDEDEASRYRIAITRLLYAFDGTFYIVRGTSSAGIVQRYDPVSKKWSSVLHTHHMLYSCAVDHDGNIYVTNRVGYWFINPALKDTTLRDYLTYEEGNIRREILPSVYADSDDNIWFGSYYSGMFLKRHAQNGFLSFVRNDSFPTAAEKETLRIMRDKRPKEYDGIRCNCVCRDGRGWTWVGTFNGVVLFQGKKRAPRYIHTEDGLSNNCVHAIISDDRDNILLTTSNGITRISNIATSSDTSFLFERFYSSDGTLRGAYSNAAIMKRADGTILAEGVDGYTLIFPDKVNIPSHTYRPILSDIYIEGKTARNAPYTEELCLKYNRNTVALVFTVPNYSNPQHTIFSYHMLSGSKKTGEKKFFTQSSGNGSLRLEYPNLYPGKYIFQIIAYTGQVPASAFSSSARQLMITVLPPWWRTPLAYLIYAILSALLIIFGIKIYLRHQRLLFLQRQKEKRLIQRINDLMLQAEMFQHEREEEENTLDASGGITDSEPSLGREDNEFINKAIDLVKGHIGDERYSVSQLAHDMCMERTGLYKRLMTILNVAPVSFIRHIRLQRAADILRHGNRTVAEVAYLTGFSSSSYFAKCFKEEFGVMPSTYKEKK